MDGILVLLRVIVVIYSNKIYFYFDIYKIFNDFRIIYASKKPSVSKEV